MKNYRIIFLSLLIALSSQSAIADSPLAGMPPVTDSNDIYSADRPNELS